jgi:excinuclease UvrABC ATPase subunit
MIKKSYRKRIQKNFGDPDTEKVFGKMNSIIILLNRCIHYALSIPKGYYKCPECNTKKVFHFDKKKWRQLKTSDGMAFMISTCKNCEGKGFIDFVSNAMRQPETQLRPARGFLVPYYMLTKPKLEAASIIFYTIFKSDHFFDPDIQFKFKSQHDKQTVKEFFDSFSKYKQKRDKRKKFLKKNFTEIRDQILKITKVSDIPARKIACKVCGGKPFDIEHNSFNDDIKLTICGNCYGYGFQSKRDTKLISNYIFEIDYPSHPKYNNKQEMLKNILATADNNRAVFTLKLGKMEFKDKRKKAA